MRDVFSIQIRYLPIMKLDYFLSVLLGVSLLMFACASPTPPAFEYAEIEFELLANECDCINAAATTYEHTMELVLDIKRLSDETRRRKNLGQPHSDALLDSVLMRSEELRGLMEGPGRQLHATCDAWVKLDGVGNGKNKSDCPHTERFLAAYGSLQAVKQGATR